MIKRTLFFSNVVCLTLKNKQLLILNKDTHYFISKIETKPQLCKHFKIICSNYFITKIEIKPQLIQELILRI